MRTTSQLRTPEARRKAWEVRQARYGKSGIPNFVYQALSWKERNRNWLLKLTNEVFAHYGHECSCCGFSNTQAKVMGRRFLQIHHINGGGRKHLKGMGTTLLKWLRKNNYPEGFTVLCAGCNASIEYGESKCLLHK